MVEQHTVLIVEDEPRTAKIMRLYLEQADYAVSIAVDGAQALQIFEQQAPHLILLDVMLPELDGWQVCRRVRERSDIPIIMVTARISDDDAVKGLQLGADDYVRKPIHMPEVIARVEANLRRAQGQLLPESGLRVGHFYFDHQEALCYLQDTALSLTTKQFQILLFLAQHPRQILTRVQIIEAVFGHDYDSYDRAIDVQMNRMRKVIEPDPGNPHYLVTVYGAGYKLIPE